jgi:hypothetical protein
MRARGRTTRSHAIGAAVVAIGLLTASGAVGAGLKADQGQVEVDVDTLGSIAADCDKGKAIAGGFDSPGFDPTFLSGPYVQAFTSRRTSRRAWSSTATNFGGAPGDLVTSVYCSKDFPRLKQKSVDEELALGEFGTVTARCKKRGEAISGGFIAAGSDVTDGQTAFPFASRRSGKRSWAVTAVGGDNVPADVTAFAYCAKQKLGLKARSAETSSTAEGATLSATAKCKKQERAVSGGFVGTAADTSEFFEPVESQRVGRRAWQASTVAFNGGSGSTLEWETFVYCLKKKAL